MSKPILLSALHHIRVEVADLASNTAFARDFGLTEVERQGDTVYWRAGGADAYSYVAQAGAGTRLSAVAFCAESRAQLERAIREYGATPIRRLKGPGGGEAVSLTDPNGNTIDIVFGIEGRQPDPVRPDARVNSPGNRQRLNVAHRYPDGPGHPLRLGHFVLFVADFQKVEQWYCRILNIVPSDRIYAAPGVFIGGFYRLDRGAEWVDHHVIGFFGMGQLGLHHMSFEVQDIEQQMVSHRFLQGRNHQSVWGVGRHPLGSHVFDMWKDPNGLRFETYSDTDWCNNERPPADHPVQGADMDMWSNDDAARYFT